MIGIEGALSSFAEADLLTEELERVLRAVGIEIGKGNDLERLCLNLKKLLDLHTQQAQSGKEDLRDPFREAVGFRHIAKLIVDASKLGGFAAAIPHLKLLNEGKVLQNEPAPREDPASNKLFELLVGLTVLRTGATVTFDDPNNAKGNNPDVLADFDGRRWGFACKVSNGTALMTLFQRIEEGIKQIENSDAATGFVVLNFKNIFPREDLFPKMGTLPSGEPLLGTHRDSDAVVRALVAFSEKRLRDMVEHVGEAQVAKAFQGKKALPGCLIVAETGVGMKLPDDHPRKDLAGKPLPALIGVLHLIQLDWSPLVLPSRFDASTWLMLSKLNEAFHVS